MTLTPGQTRVVAALAMILLCLWLATSSSVPPAASERRCEPPVPETDVTDTAADVTMCLDASGRNVQVAVAAGDYVVRTLAVGEPLAGDVGLSPAVEVGEEYVFSTFLAVRASDGRIVTAATMDSLDEAVLEADFEAGRLSEREYHRRLAELHTVPGSEDSTVTP